MFYVYDPYQRGERKLRGRQHGINGCIFMPCSKLRPVITPSSSNPNRKQGENTGAYLAEIARVKYMCKESLLATVCIPGFESEWAFLLSIGSVDLPNAGYAGYRQARAASDNQTSAHSCRPHSRPVHTAAISKRLASVTRQGSLLKRFYRLTLGKRGGKSLFMTSSVCLEWDALV